MNDLELLEVLESVEKLDGEAPYQIVVEAIEVVDLEKFKEIHR